MVTRPDPLAGLFAPELERLSAAERADVLAAVEATTSRHTWEQVRGEQRRSPERTAAVLVRMVRAVLGG